jgi:Spy/CpxP family protein refolding chaperone
MMSKLCWSLLSLALVGVPAASADDKKDDKKRDRPNIQSLLQFGRGGSQLLSEKEMEGLKLSAEQKEKVAKIVKDYEKEQSSAMELGLKLAQDLQGGGAPDVAKILESVTKMREAMTGRNKTRSAAEDKIRAVLNDEQKKQFDDIAKNRPARPGIGNLPNIPGLGGMRTTRGAFTPGQVLPGTLKDRLELTDEQKKKVEELEKKVKDELNKILTDDQKKKLEQGGRPGIRPRRNDQ